MANPHGITGLTSVEVTGPGQAAGRLYFVARDENGQKALMDARLAPLTGFDYSHMAPLPGHTAWLVVTQHNAATGYLPYEGLMDFRGRALTPLRFSSLQVQADDGATPVIHYEASSPGGEITGELPLPEFLQEDWDALIGAAAHAPNEQGVRLLAPAPFVTDDASMATTREAVEMEASP